jgi:hypothetical protein
MKGPEFSIRRNASGGPKSEAQSTRPAPSQVLRLSKIHGNMSHMFKTNEDGTHESVGASETAGNDSGSLAARSAVYVKAVVSGCFHVLGRDTSISQCQACFAIVLTYLQVW